MADDKPKMIQRCDKGGHEYDLNEGDVEMVDTTGMSPTPDNINLCPKHTREWNSRKVYEKAPYNVREQYERFLQEP